MRRTAVYVLWVCGLSACGGGGGNGDRLAGPLVPPASSGIQSPGGIWFSLGGGPAELVSLYISETGELRAVLSPDGGGIPSFGSGTVSVTSDNVVNGSFELEGPVVLGPLLPSEDLGCAISGTVVQRKTMSVAVTCSDSAGVVYDERPAMVYDVSYGRASSIEAIAGDYVLDFLPASSTLSILSDGTLFGFYDNGAQCAVNGSVNIIDAAYTLLDVSWTMSNCAGPFDFFEGLEMSGFAMRSLAPIGVPGSYYFLLTGQIADGMFAISVLYEPI